jgi:hypothetical protein
MGTFQITRLIEKFRRKTLLYFTVLFIVILSILLFGFLLYGNDYTKSYKWALQVYFDKTINNNRTSNRSVIVEIPKESPYSIMITTAFLDKQNPDETFPAKHVSINLFRESYIPISILLSLILATTTLWKRKWKALIFGLILVNLYIIFKLFILIFESNATPEFFIIKFPGLIDWIIFESSRFLKLTGFSSTIIIPIILWFLVTLNYNEVINIREYLPIMPQKPGKNDEKITKTKRKSKANGK